MSKYAARGTPCPLAIRPGGPTLDTSDYMDKHKLQVTRKSLTWPYAAGLVGWSPCRDVRHEYSVRHVADDAEAEAVERSPAQYDVERAVILQSDQSNRRLSISPISEKTYRQHYY